MNVTVITRLDRKYLTHGTVMIDPYTEERDDHLYLVSRKKYNSAILCEAIVDVKLEEQ